MKRRYPTLDKILSEHSAQAAPNGAPIVEPHDGMDEFENGHPEINELEQSVQKLIHVMKGEGKDETAGHLENALNDLIEANHSL